MCSSSFNFFQSFYSHATIKFNTFTYYFYSFQLIKMKPSVCLVCLKTFDGDYLASEEDGNEEIPCGVPLLAKFLKFTENYLNLSSVTTQQLLLGVGDRKEAFCEKCELSVINPICQVYLELLSAKLRLSSELEHLGKLIDNSRVSGSDKLRVLNINALSHQLGIRSLSQLEGFRTSLAQKCRLKRKQALPDVLLTPYYGDGETTMENDELFTQDNLEQVWVDPLALAVEDAYDTTCTLQLETNNFGSIDFPQQTGPVVVASGSGSGRAPVGTVIKLETFPHNSNPELIFENENDEVVDESPLELSDVAVIPVAERAGRRINGVYYNGYHCPKCSKVLKNEEQYQIHYRYYHLPCGCDYCGKTFARQKLLREHLKRCNRNRNRGSFTCHVCSKSYETSFKILDHMRRVHYNQNPFHSCPHCTSKFQSRHHLNQHIVAIHKPGNYPCPHCKDTESKTFTTEKYLRGHIKRIHPQYFVLGQPLNVLSAHATTSTSHTSAEMSPGNHTTA